MPHWSDCFEIGGICGLKLARHAAPGLDLRARSTQRRLEKFDIETGMRAADGARVIGAPVADGGDELLVIDECTLLHCAHALWFSPQMGRR